MAATLEEHHAILQNVLVRSGALEALASTNNFNINVPNNMLFLPRDFGLADAIGAGAARHASNRAPIGNAQSDILNMFGATIAPSGGTYEVLLACFRSKDAECSGEHPARADHGKGCGVGQ